MVESDPERSPQSPDSQTGRRLDSWKEIAIYLRRDVTTVRRWEKREGLPVHRHQHAALGSVYAYTDEIDAWQSGRQHFARPEAPVPLNVDVPILVGRDEEVDRLKAHLSEALEGKRRTVFITGELGIGKTALTQTFLAKLTTDVWVASGQCVEQYGAGEPYLPVIDALERLCRDPRYPDAARIIETRAPSWLDQISLPTRARQQRQQGRSFRADAERMAGELTAAIEALAAVKPLVLLLEDLHWSDHSTVQLIATLSRRPDRARLLVLCTYRPAELFESESPLLRVCRELRAHFQADEIELPLLPTSAVAELIARGKSWTDLQGAAASFRRWSGNPLFLVHLLEHLESSGRLVERDGDWVLDVELPTRLIVPKTLRMLVDEQLDRLEPGHRRGLEIASVVGETFPAALVADVAQQEIPIVEESFEELCKRSPLVSRRESVTWPDGVCSTSYAFVHEFYREVVYDHLTGATLGDLHRRVGTRLELAYGDRAHEISSELATHFERGRDVERAVKYYVIAAANALARSADREAQIGMSRAAELIVQLPPGDLRDRRELELRVQLAATMKSLSKLKLSAMIVSDESLGVDANSPPDLVDGLIGLSRVHSISGDLHAAREIADRAATIARLQHRHQTETMWQQAFTRLVTGEFVASASLAGEALAMADREAIQHESHGRSPSLAVLAWSSWCLGRYDEARRAVAHLFHSSTGSRAQTSTSATETSVAPVVEWLGEKDRSHTLLESFLQSRRQASAAQISCAEAARGWLLARQGRCSQGIAMLRKSERSLRDLGALTCLPQTLAWLAEALLKDARDSDAQTAASTGLDLVRRTGARGFDAELHRLRGEALMRSRPDRSAAEASFWAAITVARQQDARTLELRATLSLYRLLAESGRPDEARQTLAPITATFGAESNTPDLVQARALLEPDDKSRGQTSTTRRS